MANHTHKCPIEGCEFRFATKGYRGFYLHAAILHNHPTWYPEVADPDARANLFRDEFVPSKEVTKEPPKRRSSGIITVKLNRLQKQLSDIQELINKTGTE